MADARFCKPLDTALVEWLARSHELLVTVEEAAQSAASVPRTSSSIWPSATCCGTSASGHSCFRTTSSHTAHLQSRSPTPGWTVPALPARSWLCIAAAPCPISRDTDAALRNAHRNGTRLHS
ncbi:MAG: hypothetical protein U1F47_02255 [Hyphomicrobiales bacterium]